jgi:SEC-C motif domain protein
VSCPCGSPLPYAACCGRLHAGTPAPSAEALMRARYSAFAVGDTGYLLATWHPSSRPRRLDLDPGTRWLRLEVLHARGGLLDVEGEVAFRAHSSAGVVAETSRFVRDAGGWAYVGPA